MPQRVSETLPAIALADASSGGAPVLVRVEPGLFDVIGTVGSIAAAAAAIVSVVLAWRALCSAKQSAEAADRAAESADETLNNAKISASLAGETLQQAKRLHAAAEELLAVAHGEHVFLRTPRLHAEFLCSQAAWQNASGIITIRFTNTWVRPIFIDKFFVECNEGDVELKVADHQIDAVKADQEGYRRLMSNHLDVGQVKAFAVRFPPQNDQQHFHPDYTVDQLKRLANAKHIRFSAAGCGYLAEDDKLVVSQLTQRATTWVSAHGSASQREAGTG